MSQSFKNSAQLTCRWHAIASALLSDAALDADAEIEDSGRWNITTARCCPGKRGTSIEYVEYYRSRIRVLGISAGDPVGR